MSIRKPAWGTILGATALVVALAGTGPAADAAKLINGKLIKANTVSSKQIKDGTITSKDLSKALRTPGGKGIVGPRGPQGTPGAPGPAGAKGDKGDQGERGADGAAIAVVSFGADGTKVFSKVDGVRLECGQFCITPSKRVVVAKTDVGVYCVKVEKNIGNLLSPNWIAHVARADGYAALATMNGQQPGFAQQWDGCSTYGFEIRTFNSAGAAADRAVTVGIF